MENLYTQHLKEQIIAAYQDKTVGALERFDELTSEWFLIDMTQEKREELEKALGYNFSTDTWTE